MNPHKNRLVDLSQLDVFLTVYSLGTMSAAAETLRISQSAVSQAIAQLEQSIGLILIDRARRPLALTAAGLYVAQHGEPVIAQARRLKSQASEVSKTGNLHLRIGMIDSFAKTIGPAVVKQLYEHTSGLSIQIGMAVAQEQALLRREMDMAITTSAFIDNAAFEHRLLYKEGFIAIAPIRSTPDHQIPTLQSLAAAMPLIRFSRSSPLAIRIERILRYNQLDLPRRLEVDHADTMTLLVAQGLGWAISTPTCLMQTEDKFANSLELAPVTAGRPTRSVYLVYRRDEFPRLSDEIVACVKQSLQNLLGEQTSFQKKFGSSAICFDN
ncbi:LysR family transcriptional regulator [Glaciimonas sp. PCH181]|uniref:LysR family transcriptional regulator n=1 Tax=Glaciimonas sp. PCH181 TaxID=2133943 RepID=UPI000D387CEE|nr:LysR family transcriptional regulator [Glaciimonas sp. PCH181]PUA18061.1 hypothetical protein C7W93_19730 [Glaciimonas sp. PCH181]